MMPPIFVREISPEERQALEAGLRSRDAFTLRRSQIFLASARGENALEIAQSLSCDDQTVRNAIHGFNAHGLNALRRGSSVPHTSHAAFGAEALERFRALLNESPRAFGKPRSLWTLAFLAEVSFEQGLTRERVSDETIRRVLKRLGVNWKRAKHRITSPDSAYDRKKKTGSPVESVGEPAGLGAGLRR